MMTILAKRNGLLIPSRDQAEKQILDQRRTINQLKYALVTELIVVSQLETL